MSKIFVTSDTHFDHENIIDFCDRPFKDIYHMQEVLISNWNKVVKKDDTVYHLGDFAFCNKQKLTSIVERLNGKIILIKGNHDNHSFSFYNEIFYDFIPYPVIIDDFFILSHYPLFINKHMPYVNIHGHLHNTCHRSVDFEITLKHYNVCVENTNYTPVDFNELVKNLKQ